MRLAITVCATENYCYAGKTLGRRVVANLLMAGITEPGLAIISGDDSQACKNMVKAWKATLPPTWDIRHLVVAAEKKGDPNYKPGAQILIAKLRGAAFSEARLWNADRCWSLDSDTLPPPNALRCSLDMLNFDGGYYSISTCPYQNGLFLGGRGTPQHPIAEDFIESERMVTEELKKEKAEMDIEDKALSEEAAKSDPSKFTDPPQEWKDRHAALIKRAEEYRKKISECPPDGNVFQVTAKHGWRRRGWFDYAYPGIGKGSIVPSDWCGFGCTTMNQRALALADFTGYDGQGTEDLFIVWRRWWPEGLRLNVIAHCPCDHVIHDRKKGGDDRVYTLVQAYHETDGECVGHLRTRNLPWVEV